MNDSPTQLLEDLPEGTRFTDVLEAAQAAWMAGSFEIARDLVQRYIDPLGEYCCMRCTKMCEDEPWRINNHLGSFRVCPECATIVTAQKELLAGGDEFFAIGPTQKVQKTYRQGVTTTVTTTSSQTKFMMTGQDKYGRQRGALIGAIGNDLLAKLRNSK